ncbi:hypothetical protein PG984_005435 [Apiospora sp. TS-2023a]
MPTLEETDPAFQAFDEDGFLHNIGKCFCTDDIKPLLDPIINAIAEAMEKLGEILEKICEGMLETMKQVVDVGITAIPGGSAVKAVSWGVRAAKTLAENGKTAEDMFGNWIGPVCGDANYKGFDIAAAFQQLSEAPDSMGTSTGCSNKKGCKKPPSKPEPPKAPGKPDKPPERPTTNVPDKPSTTDKPPTNGDNPRATDTKPSAIDKTSPTTTANHPTTAATTDTSTATSTKTETDSDACELNKRAQFACAETISGYRNGGGLAAEALDRWGNTAIATRAGKNQHYWPWAQGWTPRKGKDSTEGLCDRDEWPPA